MILSNLSQVKPDQQLGNIINWLKQVKRIYLEPRYIKKKKLGGKQYNLNLH